MNSMVENQWTSGAKAVKKRIFEPSVVWAGRLEVPKTGGSIDSVTNSGGFALF